MSLKAIWLLLSLTGIKSTMDLFSAGKNFSVCFKLNSRRVTMNGFKFKRSKGISSPKGYLHILMDTA